MLSEVNKNRRVFGLLLRGAALLLETLRFVGRGVGNLVIQVKHTWTHLASIARHPHVVLTLVVRLLLLLLSLLLLLLFVVDVVVDALPGVLVAGAAGAGHAVADVLARPGAAVEAVVVGAVCSGGIQESHYPDDAARRRQSKIRFLKRSLRRCLCGQLDGRRCQPTPGRAA